MKNKFLTAGLALVIASAAACSGDGGHERAGGAKPPQNAARTNAPTQQAKAEATPAAQGAHDAGHGHGAAAGSETPAFITDAAQLKSLKPTLPPERFQGMQRLGYMAARDIPQTLAQLPCYCHCDKGFGHKSLQSCFVDDHAAHCAVCIEEALVALRLQNQEGLAPEQVRQRIIAEFGSRQ